MITLEHNRLTFRFPEVHEDATCSVSFQRTLRIPDDGKDYYLPPGLGEFPLRHLDDFAERIPENWKERGGVLMPIFQSEAMWINFEGHYPFAIKIATGKINAVSGEAWKDSLNKHPQDYVVIPEQPWLDGYCVEKGIIRQFVAMPLGEGYSVEEQLTGEAEHGGLQIIAYPMKAKAYEKRFKQRSREMHDAMPIMCCSASDMGLAPGGRMKQEIYDDPFRFDEWDLRHSSRCFVTIANSLTWRAITGEAPPTIPPTAKDYTNAGLPWFDYYGGDAQALHGAKPFKGIKSVSEMGKQKNESPLPENESVDLQNGATIVNIERRRVVRESVF